jgi:predicted TIM-barrel fold metal-dependent hydrolase
VVLGAQPARARPLRILPHHSRDVLPRELHAWRRAHHAGAQVSALVQMTGEAGPAPFEPRYYAPCLEALWDAFGARRLIFASNWPQIEAVSDFGAALRIVADFFGGKGAASRGRVCH